MFLPDAFQRLTKCKVAYSFNSVCVKWRRNGIVKVRRCCEEMNGKAGDGERRREVRRRRGRERREGGGENLPTNDVKSNEFVPGNYVLWPFLCGFVQGNHQ